MPYFLLLFESVYEIECSYRFSRRRDKNLELWGQALVGKQKLIGNVNNDASYAVPHDSANVLGGRLPSTSVVKGVCFLG